MKRAWKPGLLVLTMAAGLWAADWPQFRGPSADGISPEKGINKDWNAKPPKELWRAKMNDRAYATMSAADGKVFVIDHVGKQDVVRAINLADGKDAWTFAYDEPVKDNYGFSRATPVFDNGKLYTLSASGILHCLDAGKGEKVWSKSIIKEFGGTPPKWYVTASPVLDGDKLIVTPGGAGAAMVALNKASGDVIWKDGDDPAAYCTPAIATIGGQKQYVYLAAKAMIGVSADTGKPLWRFPWVTDLDANVATPIVTDKGIFITSGYKHGCALVQVTNNQAKAVYENTDMQASFATPVLIDGHLYGTSDPIGELVCLELAGGAKKWGEKGFERGPVMGIDGVLLALKGGNGELVMIQPDPAGFKELGKFKPLGGKSWTPPITVDGKLIIRNEKEIAAFELQ